ncbi:hypothetical protein PVL29_019461 [Vitis rotundifolia]|uniref:Uncharacterized protein n=1 Tax=Vitis rotundifolia TaxID=103349 RepID=A0AA38Z150_VITRO|nr:hypothetical protein PVL29_019461 [Vitis rotundifolia]
MISLTLGTALLITLSQNVTVMAPVSLGIAFPSGISSMETKFQEMDQMHLDFQILMLIISNLLTTTDNFLTEWEFIPAYHYQLAVHHLKEKQSCLEFALLMTESAGATKQCLVPTTVNL